MFERRRRPTAAAAAAVIETAIAAQMFHDDAPAGAAHGLDGSVL